MKTSPLLLYHLHHFSEAERTQTPGVCSQRRLQVVEGPTQTGEGSQAAAPTRTAATGSSEVGGGGKTFVSVVCAK